MGNKDSNEAAQKAFYKEVVEKDCYLLKEFSSDFFDDIIDIGANVGMFTMYASFLNSKANILSYEPCKETFDSLVSNTHFLPNVKCMNEAFGDGSILKLYDTGWSGCNLFFKSLEKEFNCETYGVPSVSLESIFYNNEISRDGHYYIKMDCEGGERFLLKDKSAIDIIKGSYGSGIEVHFPPMGNARKDAMERFSEFPTWETYNEWMNDNFSITHNIVYHCSSKANGSGVYVLLGK
jgi:FkbM family methyltransferase